MKVNMNRRVEQALLQFNHNDLAKISLAIEDLSTNSLTKLIESAKVIKIQNSNNALYIYKVTKVLRIVFRVTTLNRNQHIIVEDIHSHKMIENYFYEKIS